MALLHDRASKSATPDTRVQRPGTTGLADEAAIEQHYLEHRDAVLAMLRSKFPRLPDHEDVFQEAWAELLRRRFVREDDVENVRGLLTTIAWRRATDEWRRRKPEYVDPTDDAFALQPDVAPPVEEEVESAVDSAAFRLIIDSLSPKEAALIKLRFGLGMNAREIREQLGLTVKRYDKIMARAYGHVLDLLEAEPGQETTWTKKQRSLLLACETGIASRAQRIRAQRMVDQDPQCAAMLHTMRETMRGVAAGIPLPAVAETVQQHQGRRLEAVTGWFEQTRASGRTAANEVASRLPGGGGHATEAATASGSLLGAGAAAKAVLACLAVGGTAAVCTTAITDADPPAKPPAQRPVAAKPKVLEPPRTAIAIVRTPPPAPTPKPKPKRRRSSSSTKAAATQAPVSSPRYVTPASPAPAGSTEFGPGAVGSTAAPTAPAPAPQDGGGEFTP